MWCFCKSNLLSKTKSTFDHLAKAWGFKEPRRGGGGAHAHRHKHMHMCTYAQAHTCTQTHVRTDTDTHTCTQTRAHVHADNVHADAGTRTCTPTQAHTHTGACAHTRRPPPSAATSCRCPHPRPPTPCPSRLSSEHHVMGTRPPLSCGKTWCRVSVDRLAPWPPSFLRAAPAGYGCSGSRDTGVRAGAEAWF